MVSNSVEAENQVVAIFVILAQPRIKQRDIRDRGDRLTQFSD